MICQDMTDLSFANNEWAMTDWLYLGIGKDAVYDTCSNTGFWDTIAAAADDASCSGPSYFLKQAFQMIDNLVGITDQFDSNSDTKFCVPDILPDADGNLDHITNWGENFVDTAVENEITLNYFIATEDVPYDEDGTDSDGSDSSAVAVCASVFLVC